MRATFIMVLAAPFLCAGLGSKLSAQTPQNYWDDPNYREIFAWGFQRRCESDDTFKKMGAPQEELVRYCKCASNKIAETATSAEIVEMNTTKVMPPSLQAKIYQAGVGCVRGLR